MDLTGRTVIVSGAARGLGRSCATRFAAEGADLVISDIAAELSGVGYPMGTLDQLHETQRLCEEAGASVVSMVADVRDQGDCDMVAKEAVNRFGRVDALVNSSGIVAPSGKVTHEIDEVEWAVMLDVDLAGTWRMTKAVAPHMARQRSGSVVNIASTAGVLGYRHFAAYVAAKHGVVGLTRAAALDYAPLRVRVNALCPGSVYDDPEVEGRMLGEIARSLDVPLDEHEQTFTQAQPMNALVSPRDVAGAALWLAGNDSASVTGAVITVDGGFSVR